MGPTRRHESDGENTREASSTPSPPAGVSLARVLGPRDDGRWSVELAGVEYVASLDPSVDPAVVAEASRTGARVVVETSSASVIVGALVTARPLRYERDGSVSVEAPRFTVRVVDEALLSTATAFVRVKGSEVEAFGSRVVTRARELARVLGRMVKIN